MQLLTCRYIYFFDLLKFNPTVYTSEDNEKINFGPNFCRTDTDCCYIIMTACLMDNIHKLSVKKCRLYS